MGVMPSTLIASAPAPFAAVTRCPEGISEGVRTTASASATKAPASVVRNSLFLLPIVLLLSVTVSSSNTEIMRLRKRYTHCPCPFHIVRTGF